MLLSDYIEPNRKNAVWGCDLAILSVTITECF